MAETGKAAARGVDRASLVQRDRRELLPGLDPCCGCGQEARARLGGAEDDRAGAEDPGRDRSLEGVRIGEERHPGSDVRRHHPVLGDRDEQRVEEEALLLGRLLAGEQEIEVLAEADPAHQVAAEIPPTDFDAIGIGLRL